MTKQGIWKIFAESPFTQIQKHMEKIKQCVSFLPMFIDAVFAKDWKQAEHFYEQIRKHESIADDIKKEVRTHLPNGIFMPVDRSDLLILLGSQDKIASKVKMLSGLILSRKLDIPSDIQSMFLTLIVKCIDTVDLADKAIHQIDELIEVGFKGPEIKLVMNIINELDDIESETDNLQVSLRKSVFEIEKNISPIDAMFLYRMIDTTAEIANKAQHVGYILETMLAN